VRAFLALAGAAVLSAAAHASSFTIPAFTLTGSGGDPTLGLLPPASDGYPNWRVAGVPGGIPNRTTIYRTISPSGGDDTAALNSVLQSCPANQVVQLTAGVFKISGNGLAFATSCTLRGAGPGQQLSTGLNKVGGGGTVRGCVSGTLTTIGNASFCADPTATQLVKQDRASNPNYEVMSVGPTGLNMTGYGGPTGPSYNLASDAVQGTSSVTLTAVPNPAIKVGDIVLLDENTDNDPNVVYGPSFGPPGDGSRRWFSRQDRSLSQLALVTAVSGATISFAAPITYPFHTANQAQLTVYTGGSFLKNAGVENIFVFGGMGGDGHGNIAIVNCQYCWVKNVEGVWANGSDIGLYSTYGTVVRDSFVHETDNPNPGGGGYLLSLNNGASENLIENNILWYGNKVVVMRATGGGNVFAYNYTDDTFDEGNPEAPEAGANAGHYTTPHLELLEGNYSHNFKGDSYWGNSIFITNFRNWYSALRAAHPPLNSYSYPLSCGPLPYGDYVGRTAVDVQAYSFNNNFVGNVLGVSGQQLLSYPSTSCFFGKQGAFQTKVSTTAEWNSAGNADNVPMWQFGTYQATVNTTGNWSFVDTTINTQTLNGNWDWFTKAQHWYGTGGFVDGNGTPTTIPNSFYLSAKPAFFGTQAWPWVNPTTGATATLPAKYCFEHGQMPTCLQ
jgi:hypothetical protein